MTRFELLTLLLTVITVLLVPAIALLIRGAIKWTRTEDKLGELVTDVRHLIEDKDRVHAAMLDQMTRDRDATDRRLRFIEEAWMHRRDAGPD